MPKADFRKLLEIQSLLIPRDCLFLPFWRVDANMLSFASETNSVAVRVTFADCEFSTSASPQRFIRARY